MAVRPAVSTTVVDPPRDRPISRRLQLWVEVERDGAEMSTTEQTEFSRRTERPRMEFIEGIRGLSASYVVLHHLWQFAIADPMRPAPSWFRAATVFKYGEFGVAVFVVVSGYCLMLPVLTDPGAPPARRSVALRQASHAANRPPVLRGAGPHVRRAGTVQRTS